RKLRYSVARTMLLAQRLYEAGKITYMRTDSVNLSELALGSAKTQINGEYGKKYSHKRQFKTKSKSAQEAHEAIRPTDFSKEKVSGSKEEKALYELIWKRAIASQMSDADIERTTIKIGISNSDRQFTAKGEVVKFDGFLKVYLESTEDENGENESDGLLPELSKGQKLSFNKIIATERFTRPPARYTEANLVKKLEELGIGRPSTYAPTISTIQKRGYVHKEEREGNEREFAVITLNESKIITTKKETEITGADKGKLFPADIAMLVNDFLIEHFPQIMDYKFTAHIEDELDEIANGEIDFHKMLEEFYPPFHEKVQYTIETSERVSGERILGKDPVTGKQVSVRMARYGPVAVLSTPDDENDTPHYAALRKNQKLENISFEEALHLFELPRVVGEYEDREVIAAIGRFGPYVKHDDKFYSIKNQSDPHDIDIDEAIDVIEAKRKVDAEKTIKIFNENSDIQILNGRWGPYIKSGKQNVRVPKDRDPASLTLEECLNLVEEAKSKPKRKGRTKKK
ncbi:MAG: DNA topoisomerase I, partial [Ignavibacteria bacterium]|nr:DNA topoisomerase I [Ignavibacteria bacterium]